MRFLACAALLAFGLSSCKQEGSAVAADPKAYVLAEKGHILPPGTKVIQIARFKMTNQCALSHGRTAREQKFGDTEITKELQLDYLDSITVRVTELRCRTRSEAPSGEEKNTPVFAGTPILLKRSATEWVGQMENGASPTKEQEAEINRLVYSFNTDADFVAYGPSPRKVGDRWITTDCSPLHSGLVKNASGQINIELKGIEDHGGKKFANLEGESRCASDIEGDPSGLERVSTSLKFTIARSLSDLYDVEQLHVGNVRSSYKAPSGESYDVTYVLTMEIKNVISK